MDIWQALFLSFVQGVAEWLPISSSGHLVLFQKWLDIEASLEFDIFLHLASLLVILIFFRHKILQIIKAPFSSQQSIEKKWWFYIILSNIVTVVIALMFYDQIDYFRDVKSVQGWLVITSILLLSSKLVSGEKDINWKHALALGLAQGFAVLPGLSRSGAVIAIALAMRIKKEQAFNYGFIVAIPAIFGSFLLTAKDMQAMFSSVGTDASISFNWVYILAFVATAVISYLSLSLLKLLLKRDYFYLFFIYTLALAIVINFV